MRGAAPVEEVDTEDLFAEVLRSIQFLFDGYGWHPLTTEMDYEEVLNRTRSMLRDRLSEDIGDKDET
jgi:hypothetical protein